MSRIVLASPLRAALSIKESAPIPDFLWWKLDETSGNTAHDSGPNGYHVANLSNPSWNQGLVCAGVCGGSVLVSQDYRDPDLSISAWLTPTARSDKTINSYSFVPFPPNAISNDIPAQGGYGIGINKWTDGDARSCCAAEEVGYAIALDVPQAGVRYHMAVAYRTNGITVWLDGVPVATAAAANPANGTTYLHLGKHNDDSNYGTRRYFRGKIRDVRIFKRALTQSDIDNLVRAGPV